MLGDESLGFRDLWIWGLGSGDFRIWGSELGDVPKKWSSSTSLISSHNPGSHAESAPIFEKSPMCVCVCVSQSSMFRALSGGKRSLQDTGSVSDSYSWAVPSIIL